MLNCGGIPKYKDNNQKITKATQIEGEYKNFDNDSLKFYHNSINGEINWRPKHIDTTKFTSVKIQVLNDKRLKLDFISNSTILKSRIIKYRLRNNGFIKLRNRSFRVSGIPYIFGDYKLFKYEMGLTQTNDLILHGHKEEAGGILVVLSSGRTYTINHTYQRIVE